ncbi:MAG: glutamate synthase subunit beta [Coriobacteriaceae bacterium]|nr:glutamate synthase subunit beta [Coriobacteriaceae bacterium]
MGKTTGFLEFERVEPDNRAIGERIQDYLEFHQQLPLDTIRQQAARCMDCGVSFCHAATVVEGESIGCPLANVIPEINDLVYRGANAAAYERLRLTHPFPEFTSRVCPALCEGSCTLGEHELPVTIKEIERFLDGYAEDNGLLVAKIPTRRSGKKVAVVGSGPAGLACAYELNQLGEEVTVFERADRAGGLLMYGIPNMKLDKSIVQRRIDIMQQEGIRFEFNAEVGVNVPLSRLQSEFDAIVLCGGATKPRSIEVPGSDLQGVVPAVDYLSDATRQLIYSQEEYNARFSAQGKHVVVIGGGDTGTDCVATAIRQGAVSVVQLEIMPEASLQRQPGNPWPLWPRVKKTDYGQLEALEIFGNDPREYLTTLEEIVGDDSGKVCAVKTVRVNWEKIDNRMTPAPVIGSEQTRPADLILVAMGFMGPEPTLLETLKLDADARGNIQTAASSYQTSRATVFSAGDMRRGQSLVVWAIMEGRDAAQQVHAFLAG